MNGPSRLDRRDGNDMVRFAAYAPAERIAVAKETDA